MKKYYMIYDLDDNIICYIQTFEELVSFTGVRRRNLKYLLKLNKEVWFHIGNTYNKIFEFVEN